MRILVVAGKNIGARCVEYLLDAVPQDDYTFFVSAPEPEPVVKVLEGSKQAFSYASQEILKAAAAPAGPGFDWLLNLWGSVIFKPDVLACARHSLNIHPAYLPFGRGRDPVVWAIRHGHPAGVSLHEISAAIDEGPIWYRERIDYELPVKGKELYEKVTARCWQAFCEQWLDIRSGRRHAEPQSAPPQTPTYRRSQLLSDRMIDFDNDAAAEVTIRRLLAHDFAPGYSAQVMIGGQTYDATLSLTPAKSPSKP